MACSEGESLKDRIDRGALPIDVVSIAVQIALGLERARTDELDWGWKSSLRQMIAKSSVTTKMIERLGAVEVSVLFNKSDSTDRKAGD